MRCWRIFRNFWGIGRIFGGFIMRLGYWHIFWNHRNVSNMIVLWNWWFIILKIRIHRNFMDFKCCWSHMIKFVGIFIFWCFNVCINLFYLSMRLVVLSYWLSRDDWCCWLRVGWIMVFILRIIGRDFLNVLEVRNKVCWCNRGMFSFFIFCGDVIMWGG